MVSFTELLEVIEQVRDATAKHLEIEDNNDIIEGMNISLDLMEDVLVKAGVYPKAQAS